MALSVLAGLAKPGAKHPSQSEQTGAEQAQRAGLRNGIITLWRVVVVNLDRSTCIRDLGGTSIPIVGAYGGSTNRFQ